MSIIPSGRAHFSWETRLKFTAQCSLKRLQSSGFRGKEDSGANISDISRTLMFPCLRKIDSLQHIYGEPPRFSISDGPLRVRSILGGR